MNSTLLANLNPPQLQAVTLPHQSALILAGAGSGKTRVLTTRIAYLVSHDGVPANRILAVTFTNKAAKEMLTRLAAMLPIHPQGLWIGTFHGLCNRLLRTHYFEANLPKTFQILDSGDQLSAIKRLMKLMNVDDEKYPPRDVANFINRHKEQGRRAAEADTFSAHDKQKAAIFAEYDLQCQREGVVDFAELMLRCYELLSRNAELREHYQARFAHILVDEFQDTNKLQYQWLKLLAGTKNALFAVGDDDQSIYAFRGANVGNMRELTRDFQIETVIKLEQNYRSHGNILDAANALIQNNRNRMGKSLWTAAEGGEPIRVYEAPNDVEEAAYIVSEIQQLHREGMDLKDIALLYRSNAQSRVLEHALVSAGLAYRVHGGLRFFDRQEIKHTLAYLRLMENTDDDNALLRIINFPTRGIGARSLEQLQEVAQRQGTTLWDAAARAGGKVTAFVALIESMRQAARSLSLPEIIEQVLQHSGLRALYEKEADVKRTEAQERLANLEELVNAAVLFVHENEDDSLTAFLTHASLESGEHQAGDQDDALHLMTVHAAKGLEFHAVFISGLEEGLFPHQNSQREANGVDEERRLMYVAITRARQRLYLSFAQSRMLHGQVNYGTVSCFLDELPDEVLRWITPKRTAFAPTFTAQNNPFAHYTAAATRPAAPPPRAAKAMASLTQRSISGTAWRIGQNVSHAKFGEGVIINLESNGADARVQVKFRTAGVKWLALEYAKLTAV